MVDSKSQFAAAVAPLRTTLEDLFEQYQQRADTHNFRPLDGSSAAIEAEAVVPLSVGIGGWPIDDTLSLVNLLIHAANDHFTSACRLIAMEEPVLYADKVLFRAGIEACARANWLLDPTIDARRRCARMLTARLVDLTLRLDLVEDAGFRQATRDRREELVARARRARYTVHRNKGKPPEVEDHFPSARRAMRDLFGPDPGDELDLGDFAQGWLSGFVHSSTTGLLSARMDEWPGDAEPPGIDAQRGQFALPLGSSSAAVNHHLALAITAASIITGRHVQFCGWADEAWHRTQANAAAMVKWVIKP